MKKSGIFVKVFLYTLIFSVLLAGATAALFSQQFVSYYRENVIGQIRDSYQPLVQRLRGSAGEGIAETALRFYENNQSLEFFIAEGGGGDVLFATPGADTSDPFGSDIFLVVYSDGNLSIIALNKSGADSFYRALALRGLLAFAAILALCLIAAFLFARQMTTPIRRLADSAGKMANLEDAPPLPERKDELGILTRDVYSMYDKLKETISRLEEEILRERELEETQRYFFSAASHELKTPIAATSVLLEGMIENIGDYKNHPKYLRECVKMMDAQNELISEILEIVRLNDGRFAPTPERLDIGRLVSGVLPDFQTLAKAGGQRLSADLPDGQICRADPGLLRKALSNILLNAVQNTPEGGEIRVWSEPVAGLITDIDSREPRLGLTPAEPAKNKMDTSAADSYRLCIRNTGARIDDAVLPKLFDPFYREDLARSRKSGRSGLGLTLVRKTLESMNLDFALENTPDGVLFWMNLPKA